MDIDIARHTLSHKHMHVSTYLSIYPSTDLICIKLCIYIHLEVTSYMHTPAVIRFFITQQWSAFLTSGDPLLLPLSGNPLVTALTKLSR